ncbi:helix-turn-helix domain-containing protein [Ureibacillus aquaedulcis]|uniref:AraC family transcriptional regulator n=1 Tax=Ureibacillus aquaedulcis TaxID=3058421 RepID=A0ABT8GT88_9BACL|nr:AraC family transcriptional regulator [Ureibacillus sp. BA0131]MDN4494444.1 AraC family transcriptional regulator [Ureibacillus sp. BA0131]
MEHYEVIEKALLYIDDHLEESLTLDSVASRFNLSKYYFHRLFSAMMNCSLNQYILSRRLNASLKLVQDENLSLTDIAYQLNFGTPSSFTRAFKRQYGIAPSMIRDKNETLPLAPVPSVVKRPIKNINGDIVSDFTLKEFEAVRLCGIAFEVDLATEDYKAKIRSHSKMLLNHIDKDINGSCYVVYSNCQPNSTRFKVLFGVPYDIQIDKPYYFTVDVPQIFCARFKYFGDLLDIGNVLITDFARFLKISKQESENSDIELIQAFEDIHHLDSAYHIYVPIKKQPIDSDC